jgi:pSer/pThr/pTyr-binding forkhead associated (FHA) protein
MDVFDIFILVMRVAFIFLIYFFLYLVVRVIARELNTAQRARRAAPPPTPNVYPEEGLTGVVQARPGPGRERPVALGRLVVTEVGNASTVKPGTVFELGPVTPIGRNPNNAIRLDDDFVSGEHALLAWRDGRWYLSDVASRNGTFLNGNQVTQPQFVNLGDLIGIGRVRMRLEP